MLGAARAGARVGAEARGRPARRAGLDLRHRWRRARRRVGRGRSTTRRSRRGEFEKAELLQLEKETLGLYVSEHPLHAVREQLRRKTDCTLAELERRRDGEVVTVGGIVSAVKQLTTKKGEPMVFLTLDDPTGGGEVVVFNSTYAQARELCVADRILVIKGRVDHKQQGETKLIAMEVNGVRGGARADGGPVQARRARGAGGPDPRARAPREGVSRRVARARRAGDVDGAEDARARARLHASRSTRTSSPRRARSSAPTRSSSGNAAPRTGVTRS